MYGMIFEDIFGSTVMDFGGDTVYVFIAMIVLSDEHGYIRITPSALARRIGKDVETVKTAVANLTEPDPDSNHPTYNGRRIVPLSELTDGQENRGWLVVNKGSYRDMGSRYRRTALTNERSRRFREKNTNKNNDATPGNATQRQATQFSHTYTDTYTDTDTDKNIGRTDLIHGLAPKKFNPPTVEEVTAYCSERKNQVDPQQFVDHYTANGWKVGRNSMKDWKAAVRTWEKNHKAQEPKGMMERARIAFERYGK